MIWQKKRWRHAGSFRLFCFLVVLICPVAAGAQSAPAPPARVTNSVGMELVLIPAGTFTMGCAQKDPGCQWDEGAHQVTISRAFYMQTTEVTLAQWRQVMGAKWYGRRKGNEKEPVVNVSWYEVMSFLDKLNQMGQGSYRLPSEAEWEYACRAGTTSAFWWGDRPDCAKAMFGNNEMKNDRCVAVYRKRGLALNRPAPVGSFPPNPWGLYDMHGNVWEWVGDWFGPYDKQAVKDPQGPAQGENKVRRGGSWFRGARGLRSSNRNFAAPAAKYNTLGFRVVRALP